MGDGWSIVAEGAMPWRRWHVCVGWKTCCDAVDLPAVGIFDPKDGDAEKIQSAIEGQPVDIEELGKLQR